MEKKKLIKFKITTENIPPTKKLTEYFIFSELQGEAKQSINPYNNGGKINAIKLIKSNPNIMVLNFNKVNTTITLIKITNQG